MKEKEKSGTSPIQPSGDADLSTSRTTREVVMSAVGDLNGAIASITTPLELEEATWHILDGMPEAIKNQSLITEARNNSDRGLEAQLVAKQKSIYDDIHEELALITGIETDSATILRENDEYRGLITQRFAEEDIGSVESDDTLQRLGMLTPDEEGNLRFSFPSDTFPPHICEKWDHYIDIVARHVGVEMDRQKGNDVVVLITQLDNIRTQAHNNLSLAIKNFLKLDDWDSEKCRKLVVKMRDAKLPNLETAEKEVTADEIKRLVSIARGLIPLVK